MSDGTFLNRGLCVATAAALLVAVMTSPIRSSDDTLRPDYLRRNFGVPSQDAHRLASKSIPLRTVQVKAVSTANQEKPGRAASPTRRSSDLPHARSLGRPSWDRAGFAPPPGFRPLRC